MNRSITAVLAILGLTMLFTGAPDAAFADGHDAQGEVIAPSADLEIPCQMTSPLSLTPFLQTMPTSHRGSMIAGTIGHRSDA